MQTNVLITRQLFDYSVCHQSPCSLRQQPFIVGKLCAKLAKLAAPGKVSLLHCCYWVLCCQRESLEGVGTHLTRTK